MAEDDAIVAIVTRNLFYRRLHYYALFALAVAVIVIILMVNVLYYISGHYTKPLYFATDNIGRLTQIIPVSEPNMSDDEVIDWTVEALQAAFSYDYLNYRGQLQDSQKYFTNYGWITYMKALEASNNLVALTNRRWVVVGTVVNKPVIAREGKLPSGTYAWRLVLPMLITYWSPPYDNSTKAVNPLKIEVIIQRESVLQSYKGLGIVRIISDIATAPTSAPQAPISATPAS